MYVFASVLLPLEEAKAHIVAIELSGAAGGVSAWQYVRRKESSCGVRRHR